MYTLLPLLSAILYDFAMILTRTKCRSIHPLMLSLVLNVSFVLLGAIVAMCITTFPDASRQGFLIAPWAELEPSDWFTMAILAIVILIGSIGTAIAYQNGSPSVIGTFDFAYVGFAVLWGIVFFSEIPDAVSVIGMVLIVVAGIVSLRQ